MGMCKPSWNPRQLRHKQHNSAVEQLVGMDDVIFPILHNPVQGLAVRDGIPLRHVGDLEISSSQRLDLLPIKGVRNRGGEVDLEFLPVRVAQQMHQLILYTANIHRTCDNQHFVFLHEIPP